MSLSSNSQIKRYLVLTFSLLGLAIMGYLTYLHYAEASSFCNISETVSCDVVTTSLYSEIFGIPISLLGIGYFLTVFSLILLRPAFAAFKQIFFLTAFVLVPSLYFSLMEVAAIKAYCVLCETSKLLMVGILATSFLAIRRETRNLLRLTAPLLIAGIVVAGITYFIQTGTVIKEDYTDLARHLTRQGWVYYRSYTCSNCKRQEKLLGEAYQYLKKVECHPKGPGGDPQLCLTKNITKTPTWILEPEGDERQRLEGLQSIEALKQASNYAR